MVLQSILLKKYEIINAEGKGEMMCMLLPILIWMKMMIYEDINQVDANMMQK